jgi:hypothetical protein
MVGRRSRLDDAQQSADGKGDAVVQPRLDLLPGPAVHADLAALAALAVTDQDATDRGVQVTLGKASASLIRRPARHNKTMSVLVRKPYGVSPAQRMIATSSSTVGGSAG